jgi:hypothetical protein
MAKAERVLGNDESSDKENVSIGLKVLSAKRHTDHKRRRTEGVTSRN